MFLLLVLLFTVIPAIEIYLLFTIGGAIGGLNTVLVVILTGIFGAALAKSQGLSIINRIQGNLQQGNVPTDEFTNGLLVFGGGLLLLTPGFLTDILGFCMVMPGTRTIMAMFLKELLSRSIKNGSAQFYTSSNYRREDVNTKKEVAPDVFEADFHETKVTDVKEDS